jgi:hypothetical protein
VTQFRRVLEALDAEGVRYVVIGGAALGFQGSGYRTEDIDIVYARDENNIERLVTVLGKIHPRLRVEGEPDGLPFIVDARTISNGGNFTLQTDLGDLDIMATIPGLGDYENVMRYADQLELIDSARPTSVLSLDGLIIAKRAANRPKDLVVLPEIESLRELRELDREL